ncbi:MAG: TIGR01777 family oxidoreductase [Verrucomicrobia bacterium]|nr:TIGR01777 family oxidoreductase [Verrucomicrobiota bacterium]
MGVECGVQNDQRVAILGVSGFVGRGLPALLAAHGMSVTGVSRSETGNLPGIDRWQSPSNLDFSGHRAVINLAGESVAQRWNQDARRRLRESRIEVTRSVVAAIRRLPADRRPEVLLNASAVGYYGDGGDAVLTELSAPGSGFLADLCRAWEAAAREAEALGVRVVCLRLGMVLGRGGLAFERLRRVFQWGLGGRLGQGRQWQSWIHLDDLRAAMLHAVTSSSLRGAVNATAPAPERNVDFTLRLAAVLHRPAVLPVPAFALKLALGGFASVLLEGQRAVPNALVADGFRFNFPNLEAALTDLCAC